MSDISPNYDDLNLSNSELMALVEELSCQELNDEELSVLDAEFREEVDKLEDTDDYFLFLLSDEPSVKM